MAERLTRRLGTGDAVVIGLGSMLGAGVFAAFGPAARAAGTGLLIGLLAAAVIAYCNATASAQLAAVYPTSGGTYVYGRERLGHWWGFTAGWGFVVGKTASCAAMALTFASYAVPGPWWAQRAAAVAAVLGLAALNYRGVTRTALLTRVLVAGTLTALAVVVAGIAAGGDAGAANLGGWASLRAGGAYGVLQAAGLLFFAFAGYARIATMGRRSATRAAPSSAPSRSPCSSRSRSTWWWGRRRCWPPGRTGSPARPRRWPPPSRRPVPPPWPRWCGPAGRWRRSARCWP